MAEPVALVLYAVAALSLGALVLFSQHDRGFPLTLSRRAGAILLGLDAAMALIALPSPKAVLNNPGWLMTLALLGAANLVGAFGLAMRAVSLPPWLRILGATACFVAVPVLWVLLQ